MVLLILFLLVASLADYLGFNFGDYSYKSGDEDIDVELPALLPSVTDDLLLSLKNIGLLFCFASMPIISYSFLS